MAMSANQKYWSAISTAYDAVVGEAGDASQRLVINPIVEKLLGDLSGKTVLDGGCGNGYWSRKLSKTAKKVVGIDFTSELITKAKARGAPKNVNFFVGNLENLSLKSEMFDVVLLNMVLIDIENLNQVVSEISRVTMLGGLVVISITHPCFENPPNTYSLKNDQNQTTARIISNYFKEGLVLDEVNQYQHYHYTLSSYLNCFVQNSLVIDRIEEPNSAEIMQERTDRHPYFLIIKLRKQIKPDV